MQRQRQELSQAVRQLTENSNTLYQQIKPNEFSSHIKKRNPSIIGWMETDLDSMAYIDHGSTPTSSSADHTMHNSYSDFNNSTTPLYIDTSSASSNILNCSSSTNRNFYGNHKHQESDGIESSGMESESDLLEGSQFSNLSKQEKQESKTVRIVKRESQQRQRDRERTGNVSFSNQNLDQVMEEEMFAQQQQDNYAYNRSKSLPRTFMETHEIYRPESNNKMKIEQPKQSLNQNKYSEYYNNMVNQYPVSMTDNKQQQQQQQPKTSYLEYTSGLKHKTESIQSLTKSIGDLSPVFQSEAAKQIMIEIGANPSEEINCKVPGANKQRRAVPKEKRRHYTAPHHLSAKSMQAIQAENDMNRNVSFSFSFF